MAAHVHRLRVSSRQEGRFVRIRLRFQGLTQVLPHPCPPMVSAREIRLKFNGAAAIRNALSVVILSGVG